MTLRHYCLTSDRVELAVDDDHALVALAARDGSGLTLTLREAREVQRLFEIVLTKRACRAGRERTATVRKVAVLEVVS